VKKVHNIVTTKLSALTCSEANKEPRANIDSVPPKKKDIFYFMDEGYKRHSDDTGAGIADNTKKYIEEPVEDIYWSKNLSKHPNIAQVATSVLKFKHYQLL